MFVVRSARPPEVTRAVVTLAAALAGCAPEESSEPEPTTLTTLPALPAAEAAANDASDPDSAPDNTEGGNLDLDGVPNEGQAPTDAEAFITDVRVGVHPRVKTVIFVAWTQTEPTDDVWLEFAFEAGDVMRSRAVSGAVGAHEDVLLGVPGSTAVTFRVVASSGSDQVATREYRGATEAVPSGMPVPEVLAYEPALASPERWLLGAVEDSDGGCNGQSCYYHTIFWLYIMDRKGRIVWYYADPASNATSSFQRIARDGGYIWIEKRPFGGGGQRGVLKMTLDRKYMEQIMVPGLSDAIDVTTSGSLLYDVERRDDQPSQLREMTADGDVRSIWSCHAEFGPEFRCYSNTVNWNERDDTVLMSFPYENTVAEIDRESGELVASYGDAPGSYDFSPETWGFEFQHFPNITADGTLLVSSHMPGFSETEEPVRFQHAFMEFEIDRDSRTLVERWIYNEGPEWAMYKGMAIRLGGGNTLANYGTGGVIREITPDKQTAFMVKFDSRAGNDFFNKMVGHNVLVDDLYALNSGPR